MTRSCRGSSVLVWIVTVAAMSAACGGSEAPESASAGSPAWALAIQPQAPPATTGSFAPQLTHSKAGVLLSWLERDGDTFLLRFSERAPARDWSAARTAASGTNWFASWADAPSVLRLSSGTLVANWFVNTRIQIEAYDIYMSHSNDDGRTWAPPFSPHRDATQTQHGFASLVEMPDKGLGLIWLDGRDMENNTTDPEGGVMTLRFTSFDPAWKQGNDIAVNARVCECCQTAAVVVGDQVMAAFRDRRENEIRDIAVARLEKGRWTSPQLVHADNYQVDTCPVNGPALSTNGRDVAAAWFTVIDDIGHAYASFSHDGGNRWSAPVRLDEQQSLGYVDVELLDDGSAAATWVEFTGGRRQFRVRRVEPFGAASPPVDIAGLAEGRVSGYPRMARAGDELVFAWTESAEDESDENGQQIKGAVARLPRTTAP